MNVVPGFTIVGAAILAAVRFHHTWSWPLFAWGVVVGVASGAWAYWSTRVFGLIAVKRAPAQRSAVQARAKALWPKYRAVYITGVLMGVGVGILAAGLDRAIVDIAWTTLWILFGVLPGLIAFPIAMRRMTSAAPDGPGNGAR